MTLDLKKHIARRVRPANPYWKRAQAARPISERCDRVVDMACNLARLERATGKELIRLHDQPELCKAVYGVMKDIISKQREELDSERSVAYGQSEVWSGLIDAGRAA